ncbi:MAG: OmpA family protein [Desulfobacterales bacterium]|nr:OmpA family protein [Desulfobacterales bacterium]
MKQGKPFLLWALALLMLWALPLHADEIENKIEITPTVGGHFFEGNQDLEDGYSIGLILGIPVDDKVTLEVGGTWIKTEQDRSDIDVDAQRVGFDWLYHLKGGKKFTPFVLGGVGLLRVDPENGEGRTDVMVNYGAGFKYDLKKGLALRVDLRHVMPVDKFHNNISGQVGLTWTLGKEKMMAKPMESMKPMEPMMMPMKMDSDGDGVPDDRDMCAETPMGQMVDELGCPVVVDDDNDGMSDEKDKCLDTPKGAMVDMHGCWVLKGVNFAFGKAELLEEHRSKLDEVSAVLKANPKVRIVLEGHADNIGSAMVNEQISLGRAKAAYDYLVNKGIDGSRMQYLGHSHKAPVADNSTVEGRKMNRRVELRVVK